MVNSTGAMGHPCSTAFFINTGRNAAPNVGAHTELCANKPLLGLVDN